MFLLSGVAPPVVRDEVYFDPGAKYHVAGGVGYIRYFNAHVYEFQFYRELCRVSGQYDPNDPNKPLHRCNFYGIKYCHHCFNHHYYFSSKNRQQSSWAEVAVHACAGRLQTLEGGHGGYDWQARNEHRCFQRILQVSIPRTTNNEDLILGLLTEFDIRPLEDWLREENAKNGVHVGWRVPDYGEYCKSGKVSAGSNIANPSIFGLVVALAAAVFVRT